MVIREQMAEATALFRRNRNEVAKELATLNEGPASVKQPSLSARI